jgi:hypothetical protein
MAAYVFTALRAGPVRRGGLVLKLYSHSLALALALALFLLFLLSWLSRMGAPRAGGAVPRPAAGARGAGGATPR